MLPFLEKYSKKKPNDETTLFPTDRLPEEPSITLHASDKPHLIAISFALSMDEWLIDLILADVHIGNEGCRILCASLKNNKTLKKLDLSGNFLEQDSCRFLGDMLQINSNIEHLLLELNNLGVYEDEFRLFCIGLSKNSGLRYIDLRNNQITSQGGQSLAEALCANITLKYIDLRWNIIGILASKYFVNLTNRNRQLLELKLEGNDIPSVEIQLIYKNLDSNRLEFRFESNQHSHDRIILNLLKEMKDSTFNKPSDPRFASFELERNKLLDEIINLKEKLNSNSLTLGTAEKKIQLVGVENVKLIEKLANEMRDHDDRIRKMVHEHETELNELKRQNLILEREKTSLDLDLEKISFKCTSYIDELKILKSIKQAPLSDGQEPMMQQIINALKAENESLKKENLKLSTSKVTGATEEQVALRVKGLLELQQQVAYIKAEYNSLKHKYKLSFKDKAEMEVENKRLKVELRKEIKAKHDLKESLDKNKDKLKMQSKEEKLRFLSVMGHLRTEIDGYCDK